VLAHQNNENIDSTVFVLHKTYEQESDDIRRRKVSILTMGVNLIWTELFSIHVNV